MKTTVLASLTCLSLGAASVLMPGIAVAADSSETSDAELTAHMGPAGEYQRGLTVNGVAPTLRSVVVDGESILAYCIEYWIQAADPDHESAVTTWDEFTGENHFKTDPQVRENVAWILRHSYPTLSLDEVAQQTGAVQLSAAEVLSATQAAIWHFTDDFVPEGDLVVEDGPTAQLGEHSFDNVQRVFDYLTGDSNTGLTEQQVQASVTLEDSTDSDADVPETILDVMSDDNDHVFGPIELNASAAEVELDLHPVDRDLPQDQMNILDGAGQPVDIDEPVSVDELWVHIPAELESGAARLTAASVEYGYTGRLIIPEPDGQRRFQTIVVVDQATDHASTEIELAWEQPVMEEPEPSEEPPVEEPPLEPQTPAEPVVEEPPVPEPVVEEPPVPDPQVEEAPAQPPQEEEPPVTTTPQVEPDMPEEPEPAETPVLQETQPQDITEAEPAAELATTGAQQSRNILIALATVALGIGLVLVNRRRRSRT